MTMGAESGWVEVRTWCDHLSSLSSDLLHIPTPDTTCCRCQHPGDNWLCLSCKDVLCSRFVNKHMLQHYQQIDHCLSLSYSDLSVWCYSCEAYIDAQVLPQLQPVLETAYILKFGESPPLRNVETSESENPLGWMVNSTSGSKSIGAVKGPVFCKCGARARLAIARTKMNNNRPFYGCARYNMEDGCNYFRWAQWRSGEGSECTEDRDCGRKDTRWVQSKLEELRLEQCKLREEFQTLRKFVLSECKDDANEYLDANDGRTSMPSLEGCRVRETEEKMFLYKYMLVGTWVGICIYWFLCRHK